MLDTLFWDLGMFFFTSFVVFCTNWWFLDSFYVLTPRDGWCWWERDCGPRWTTVERQLNVCLGWFLRTDHFYRLCYRLLRADLASYASMWTGRLCGCSALPISQRIFSSPFVDPWNEHDSLATPPACVTMHNIASVLYNWLRPSFQFHSNVGQNLMHLGIFRFGFLAAYV